MKPIQVIIASIVYTIAVYELILILFIGIFYPMSLNKEYPPDSTIVMSTKQFKEFLIRHDERHPKPVIISIKDIK